MSTVAYGDSRDDCGCCISETRPIFAAGITLEVVFIRVHVLAK
jgi:hypothetical protein